MLTRLLKTTIQFWFCVRSKSRLARVGIDTLGSSVQRRRSGTRYNMSLTPRRKALKFLTLQMFPLWPHELLRGCLAHGLGQTLSGQRVPGRQHAVVQRLTRRHLGRGGGRRTLSLCRRSRPSTGTRRTRRKSWSRSRSSRSFARSSLPQPIFQTGAEMPGGERRQKCQSKKAKQNILYVCCSK